MIGFCFYQCFFLFYMCVCIKKKIGLFKKTVTPIFFFFYIDLFKIVTSRCPVIPQKKTRVSPKGYFQLI